MNNFFSKKLSYIFYKRSTKQVMASIGDDYPSNLEITFAGLPSLNSATIRIYNLNKNVMNLLTFLNFRSHEVSDLYVECLNENKTVFIGDIINSTPVYNMPNPYLDIKAMTDILYLVSPSPEISYAIVGNRDYTTISVPEIAKRIFSDTQKALVFHDVGLIRVLDPHYRGSKIEQLEKLKTDADINIVVNYDNVKFFSKYKGATFETYNIDASNNSIVEQISNDKEGINFSMLFNNNLELGSKIQIYNDKINRQANGVFYVYDLTHRLSNKIPGAEFFTHVRAHFLQEEDNGKRF